MPSSCHKESAQNSPSQQSESFIMSILSSKICKNNKKIPILKWIFTNHLCEPNNLNVFNRVRHSLAICLLSWIFKILCPPTKVSFHPPESMINFPGREDGGKEHSGYRWYIFFGYHTRHVPTWTSFRLSLPTLFKGISSHPPHLPPFGHILIVS